MLGTMSLEVLAVLAAPLHGCPFQQLFGTGFLNSKDWPPPQMISSIPGELVAVGPEVDGFEDTRRGNNAGDEVGGGDVERRVESAAGGVGNADVLASAFGVDAPGAENLVR